MGRPSDQKDIWYVMHMSLFRKQKETHTYRRNLYREWEVGDKLEFEICRYKLLYIKQTMFNCRKVFYENYIYYPSKHYIKYIM